VTQRDARARELPVSGHRHPDEAPMDASDLLDWNDSTKYRVLADSIDEGFCVIESLAEPDGTPVDYRFLEINRAFERQTGLIDAIGRTVLELAPTHERFWIETYAHVASTGESLRFEHTADALGRFYDVFAFRIGDPAGRRVGILFNDVSERAATRRALQLANQRKDEFMAVLAHELRNPLAPMRFALELMRRLPDSPDAMERARGILERQVRHMTALVGDLTDLGRIARGTVSMDASLIDLREVVRHAVEVAHPVMVAREHALSVSVPETPVQVHGDAHRLAQAVSNLLVNAAKYTVNGGRVALVLDGDDSAAVIDVSDTGIGIAPERLDDVFEMFTQLPVGHAHAQGGLGIGLALVKQIVEMHGGTVQAISAGTGAGSRFSVRLPVTRPGTPPAPSGR
jgi:signal transduction histidine kinase